MNTDENNHNPIRPGISDDFLLAAGVEVLSDGQYSLRIPYRDWKGNFTGHCRWRLRRPTAGQKYDQRPDSGAHVYFHHRPLGEARTLFGTEGEFKSLALAEAGCETIGFPGLHCYTRQEVEGEELAPVLLKGILEAVATTKCERLVFVGDSDTLTNIEYYRSAGVLAQGLPEGVSVGLLQVPLGGPKGVDDIRHAKNSQFPEWLAEMEAKTLPVDKTKSFLVAAAHCLEARGKALHELPPADRDHQIERLVRMAAYARISKEGSLAIVHICHTIQKLTKLNKDTFNKVVEEQVREIVGGDADVNNANEKIAYYDRIQPWPVDRPLEDIIAESRDITSRFVVVDPRCVLLTSCWAVGFTFAYPDSPYLPMLVVTGAEEDSGKTTYIRVVGRQSYRAYRIVSATTIHRVVAVYRGTFLLDECKDLSENRDLRAFLNDGFDNNSNHPVDSSFLPRYDMESGQLLEFDPRFPKICAGIGTFLERDTLSRSLVINMERYTAEESRGVKEYCHCTDDITLPIYRASLGYWTEDRQREYGAVCREVLRDIPSSIRSRQRQKFVPLLAVAKLGGRQLFDETLAAIEWFSTIPDTSNPQLGHRLLCDIARIFHRQVLLHKRTALDPITGAPSVVLRQPTTGVYLMPTQKLVELLLALPEAPWKCYGRDKRPLDDEVLYSLLRPYKLVSERLKITGTKARGLTYQTFCERYERFRRPGDPGLESVRDELDRDFGSPDDPSDEPPNNPPGGPGKPPPTHPAPPGSGTSSKAPDAGSTPSKENIAGKNPKQPGPLAPLEVNPLDINDLISGRVPENRSSNSEGVAPNSCVDNEGLTTKGARGPGYFGVFSANIPDSTPKAGLRTEKPTLGLLPVDIETYYPWPEQGEFPQPPGAGSSLKKRQSLGKAHPYAKDPRRCAIRFLTTELDGVLYTHDFLAEPELPEKLKYVLAHSVLVGHNLDFDVTVLRRYGVELSSTWIDTMLAARLLGLGKERGSEDAVEEEDLDAADEEKEPVNQTPLDNPADNGYGAVVARYLGIHLAKDCGGSDWSGQLSQEQLDYIKNDVIHLLPLWEVLQRELQAANIHECFAERMEFAPRLNTIKMTGVPVDSSLCESDRERAQRDLQEQKGRIQAAFSGLLFPVPKSRCKKSKRGKGGRAGKEGPPPALASLGVRVEDTKMITLERVDAPEAELFIGYAKAKSRHTMIKGISRNTFPDGRARASGWNQIAARTGRLHSVEPNLQNLPRDWRGPFKAPGGWQWLKSDLSQIEMVIIALHYCCERLRDLLAQGLDVYVHTAAGVFGKAPIRSEEEVSELLRSVAKMLTLGISYVLGERSFIKRVRDKTGLQYTPEQARGFYTNFFLMFPEIKQAQERVRIDALEVDSVYTVIGQRRFLPPLLEDQIRNRLVALKGAAGEILVNTPIQGSCANLYIRALNLIIPRLPAEVEVVNLVHDEVDLIVPHELELKEHTIGPSWAEGTIL